MDEQRLHEKLDKIIDKVTNLEVTAAQHEETLKYHIYRTDLAEENHKTLKEATEEGFVEIKKEIEPLKHAYLKSIGAFKILGILLTVAGVIVGILKLRH